MAIAGRGVTTVYVYDAFGNLEAEYSSNSPASPCGAQTCYLTLDYLGSTRMLTDTADANGSSTVKRYDYLPFGRRAAGFDKWADDGNGIFQQS